MNIFTLIIEVTRWCNMQCPHCMRGERQKKKIKEEYINMLFERINAVATLSITGGEPNLAMDRMWYIQKAIEKYKVNVNSFYWVTNGKYIPKDFVELIRWFYKTCDDNEISQIEISQDDFHESINKERIYRLQDELMYDWGIEKPLIKFKSDPNKHGFDWLINQGRASNGYNKREVKVYPYKIEDGIVEEGDIYLNCKGNIISHCDFSYESQDNPDNIVCHISELSMDKLIEYNERRFGTQKRPSFIEQLLPVDYVDLEIGLQGQITTK